MSNRQPPPFHAATWLAWVGTAVVVFSTTRNPLYLLLALLSIFVVVSALQDSGSAAPPFISPLKFTLVVLLFSTLFNTLTTHHGQTVLLLVPAAIPLLGGKITLEAAAYGLINGLVVAGLFATFTVLNMALPVRAIIRFIPRAFYPLAVVTSIAITFVPTTLRQMQHIREAQAVRGHRLRGLRGWLPLVMPLLTGGLEQALQLAEAMTARGFASADETVYDTRLRATVVAGLVALPGGWLLWKGWGHALPGGGLMLLGAALIAGVLRTIHHRAPRTTYHRERWTRWDGIVLPWMGVLLACALALVPGIERKTFSYSPYPEIALPPFEPLVGIVMLGLGAPAVLALAQHGKRQAADVPSEEPSAATKTTEETEKP